MPSDSDIRRAIQTQDSIEHAEALGTPQGLRSLFPTNLVASRTRQIQAAEIQRRKIIMNQKAKREELERNMSAQQQDVPDTDHADSAQERPRGSVQHDPSADSRGGAGGPVEPATPPILPNTNTSPGPNEKQMDPGPSPSMPAYGGPASPVVDQLVMCAAARDADAVRAIPTRNEPPQVGQYKANLLQWLDDVEDHERSSEAMRNAQAGTNPDEAQR